jgi:hypothetical protein
MQLQCWSRWHHLFICIENKVFVSPGKLRKAIIQQFDQCVANLDLVTEARNDYLCFVSNLREKGVGIQWSQFSEFAVVMKAEVFDENMQHHGWPMALAYCLAVT